MNQILGIKEIKDSPKEFGDGDIKVPDGFVQSSTKPTQSS